MSRRRVSLLLAAVALLTTGFAIAPAPNALAAGAQHSRSAVYVFPNGPAIPGAWSTLVTNDAGATMTLHTTGLPAGDAVTVWWIIFNHPENCEHGENGLRCGEGDLLPFGGNPAVASSVVYAAGHVIGGSGVGSFGAWIGVGDTGGALFGDGLTNPLGADIHLIVRDHGPAAGITPDGFKMVDVCNPVCFDPQFAAHEQ